MPCVYTYNEFIQVLAEAETGGNACEGDVRRLFAGLRLTLYYIQPNIRLPGATVVTVTVVWLYVMSLNNKNHYNEHLGNRRGRIHRL